MVRSGFLIDVFRFSGSHIVFGRPGVDPIVGHLFLGTFIKHPHSAWPNNDRICHPVCCQKSGIKYFISFPTKPLFRLPNGRDTKIPLLS